MMKKLILSITIFAALIFATIAFANGHPSSVLLTPSQPVAGQPVTVSWTGPTSNVEYVRVDIWCNNTNYGGYVYDADEGGYKTFAVTFPNPDTNCVLEGWIYSETSKGGYQNKYTTPYYFNVVG